MTINYNKKYKEAKEVVIIWFSKLLLLHYGIGKGKKDPEEATAKRLTHTIDLSGVTPIQRRKLEAYIKKLQSIYDRMQYRFGLGYSEWLSCDAPCGNGGTSKHDLVGRSVMDRPLAECYRFVKRDGAWALDLDMGFKMRYSYDGMELTADQYGQIRSMIVWAKGEQSA